jgi:hypothetical protein
LHGAEVISEVQVARRLDAGDYNHFFAGISHKPSFENVLKLVREVHPPEPQCAVENTPTLDADLQYRV